MPAVSQVKRPRMEYVPGEPGANLFGSAPPPTQQQPTATSTPHKELIPSIRMMFDETPIAVEHLAGPSVVPAGGDMPPIMDIAEFIRQAEYSEQKIDDIIQVIDGLDLNNLYIHAIDRANMLEYKASLDARKLTVILKQRDVRFRFILHSCGYSNSRCVCIKNKLLELPMSERKNKRVNPHNVHNLNYVNTIYSFFANIYYKHVRNMADLDGNSPEMLGISLYIKTAGK